jgi:hypothetical protein
MGLEGTMRVIGWLGLLAILSVLGLAIFGRTLYEGGHDGFFSWALALSALVALTPLLIMVIHLNVSKTLSDEDKRMWRTFMLWGGPVAACVYLAKKDRAIATSPKAEAVIKRLV